MLSYICHECKAEFEPRYKPSNSKRPFCSRSCAIRYNNQAFPKRKVEGKCSDCGISISTRYKTCETHRVKDKEYYSKISIGEYRNKASVKGKHPSWANAHIRYFARLWNINGVENKCEECSYDKHVEIAHIKPVSSFPDSALLGEVNSRSNVRVLCPNCHWEFDNLPRSEN